MKTHLKAVAVTTAVLALVLLARPVVAFPLGSGTFGTSIFGDSDGDLVQDAFDAFPLDGRGHSDADLDGLPDEWENANGLNSSNPNDAEFDADRDGFTNAEEFKSATDPSVSNGKSQIVVITAPVAMARGSTASVSLSYDTSDANSNLSGLGIRVHLNSQVIESVSFDNVLNLYLVGNDNSFSDDSFDYDNDGSTDVFVTLAWAAITSPSWPGELPKKLADITLTVKEQSNYGETSVPIRVTASSTATGYRLSANPASSTLTDGSFDVDGDGKIGALTDGLLLMRSMFGFRNDALITGAIADDAIRKTAAEVESHIAGLTKQMDIDADGNVDALTDGLLMLRYLFDFRRESLIAGAVAADGERKTAAEIEAYLAAILPSSN